MKKNVRMVDKVIRILIAVVMLVLFFTHVVSGTAGLILLVVAGVLVLTSLISFCPLYWTFGLITKKKA